MCILLCPTLEILNKNLWRWTEEISIFIISQIILTSKSCPKKGQKILHWMVAKCMLSECVLKYIWNYPIKCQPRNKLKSNFLFYKCPKFEISWNFKQLFSVSLKNCHSSRLLISVMKMNTYKIGRLCHYFPNWFHWNPWGYVASTLNNQSATGLLKIDPVVSRKFIKHSVNLIQF